MIASTHRDDACAEMPSDGIGLMEMGRERETWRETEREGVRSGVDDDDDDNEHDDGIYRVFQAAVLTTLL